MKKEILIKCGMLLSILCLAGCVSYEPIQEVGPIYSRAQISADFDELIDFVSSTHPDLSYSADLEALEAVSSEIRHSLPETMSLREAWMVMAQANPFFGDAHTGLRRPVTAIQQYKEEVGMLFPLSVVFDRQGVMRAGKSLPENSGLKSGDEVVSINGVETSEIIRQLIPRMRGESPALQRLILERYFPQFYWLAFGGFHKYVVEFETKDSTRIIMLDSSFLPQQSTDSLLYSYTQFGNRVGYMDVPSFGIEHKTEFSEFLKDAFLATKTDGVENLIIDLRKNGGGAHDVSDLLMEYLTGKPFSAVSGITARVTEENIARIPGANLGDVLSFPFQQTITPTPEFPLRFSGNVYVLVGALTYSQAIVFASTVQDYEIAVIAGEATEGPANQTGQVQSHPLANTGIEALAPIYIFRRPNGDDSRRGVIPDIIIENDPLNPMVSVKSLIENIK